MGLIFKPSLLLFHYRSASLKASITKQYKHGSTVISLPFNAAVTLPAYFAICCDVLPNPGPTFQSTVSSTYTRDKLLDIGKSLSCSEVNFKLDSGTTTALKLHNIYNKAPSLCHQYFYSEDKQISASNIHRGRKDLFIHQRNKISQISTLLHTNEFQNSFNHKNRQSTRNATNLINVNIKKTTPYFSSYIRIGTWNAHSLNKKSAAICDLIISKRLDVLTVTESWLSGDYHGNNTIAEILNTLKDYDFHHVPRANRTGGGVAVFLRKNFKVSQIPCQPFSSMEYMDLAISYLNSSIRLITIYRPPQSKKNQSNLANFVQEFSTLLETVSLSSGYLLLNGDFNFHMDSPDDRNASIFRDLLKSFGLKQHVKARTHRCGHTLDLLIDRQEDEVISNIRTVSDLPSDHDAVLCSIAFERPNASKLHFKHRKLKNIDRNALKVDLLSHPLCSEIANDLSDSCTDVNDLTDLYNHTLRELLNTHAPEMSRSVTLRPNAPWYNDFLRNLKRQKRQHERKYRITGLEVHRQMYRNKCQEYTTALNSAKADYYSTLIKDADQSKLFSVIDNLFKVKPVPPLPSYESLHSLAEDFNNFFVTKTQVLRDNLQKSGLNSLNMSIMPNSSPCQFSFAEFDAVSENSVKDLILQSKSKSCMLDPAPTSIVKQLVDVIAKPLTRIINVSLSSGIFPSCLKKGIVRPTIKKHDLNRDVLSNYRPITNIAFLSKILERVVSSQLTNYLTSNNLLPRLQSAYRRFYSVETAILRVFNDILAAIDDHQDVVLVLLDLSSAFDTIDHLLLLERLQKRYGIDKTVLKWLGSYLEDRTQAVRIKDVSSPEEKVLYGVPQGSVLGPLMFALFFAPLEDVIVAHGLRCMMYADDTQLYISVNRKNDRSVMISKIETCIMDILIWCTKNGLACNPDKTEVLHLTSRFARHHEQILGLNINNVNITPSLAVRDLGVIVDPHLQMTKHVNNICKSGFFALKNIGKIRNYISQSDCERLVHAFITSKLDMCNSILIGLPSTEIDKLQRLQNTAARLLAKAKKNDHITPLLKRLHWLPVRARIEFKILLMTYKALNNQAPDYIKELVVEYKPDRSLRSSPQNLLVVPPTKTKTGDRAFQIVAPKLWNLMPNSIRLSNTLSNFKSSVKTYLFNKHFS